MTGSQDKKIYQFDTNTGEITQEYDQHLGAVNTIAFIDENRRFVSTSDDKTIRVWDFDIPVVVKYIADPGMHSMPAVNASLSSTYFLFMIFSSYPLEKWLAYQCLDNHVYVYSASDKFRMNKSKVFRGHLVAGYACQPSFSPDERYVTSGDSTGKVYFWEWKTNRIAHRLKAHDSIVMGVEWHPHETSKVATCSWDGTIKYWD